jgi:hypothetical protein
MEPAESSLDLALADIELLRSAYPDETVFAEGDGDGHAGKDHCHLTFPLAVTLHLSENALMELEFNEGYPTIAALKVSKYRSTKDHDRLEAAVKAVQKTALECLEDGMEGALPCCAAAFEAWNEVEESCDRIETASRSHDAAGSSLAFDPKGSTFTWTSGEPLTDRKSSFQAHACRIASEQDVKTALQQLLSNNKIMKATHNMVRERRRRPVVLDRHFFTNTINTYLVGVPLHKQKSR